MIKVYTKAGDDGTTGLYGGGSEFRVYKHFPQIDVVGTVDEAMSFIGLAKSMMHNWDFRAGDVSFETILKEVIRDLFEIGAELGSINPDIVFKNMISHVDDNGTDALECFIDDISIDLPELRSFVMPTGCDPACALFTARSVVRRLERQVVGLASGWAEDNGFTIRPGIIKYLNRLGDLLFVMARYCNHKGIGFEDKWIPEKPTKESK